MTVRDVPTPAPRPKSIPTSVPDPLVAPLCQPQYLVERIAELSGRPLDEVTRRLHDEYCDLGHTVRQAMVEWGIQPYVWSDRLLEFYGATDAFLYETTAWNRMPTKNSMREWIARHLHAAFPSSARVLTYGDGLGFDSLYFAQAGHQVDFFDVSTHGAAFAGRPAISMKTLTSWHRLTMLKQAVTTS